MFKLSAKQAVYASHEMICDNDDDALRRAAEVAHDCPGYELWEGARKVGGFMNGISQQNANIDVPVRTVV